MSNKLPIFSLGICFSFLFLEIYPDPFPRVESFNGLEFVAQGRRKVLFENESGPQMHCDCDFPPRTKIARNNFNIIHSLQ